MKITELKGRPQVFTLKDGKTLRIFARKSAEVADSNISNEMRIAEKMGLIMMTPVVKTTVVTEEVPKNTKSGGKK